MEEDKKQYRLSDGLETTREAGQGSAMPVNKGGKSAGNPAPGAKPRKSTTTKKSHSGTGDPSSSLGSASAATTQQPGGSKKRPSQAQGHGFESSSHDSEDVPLDDEDETFSGQHLNNLLSQLGSQIQTRVRAKKQKLDKNFQVIQGFLENVQAFQKDQTERRAKMIEEFQTTAGALAGKLNEIIQMQLRNDEKQGKMMMAVTRENEEVKQLVTQCGQIQQSIFEKFYKEYQKLVNEENQEATFETEQAGKEIFTLQKKLLSESQKEGSEMFSRFGNL